VDSSDLSEIDKKHETFRVLMAAAPVSLSMGKAVMKMNEKVFEL